MVTKWGVNKGTKGKKDKREPNESFMREKERAWRGRANYDVELCGKRESDVAFVGRRL
jgi:hypothetical protein